MHHLERRGHHLDGVHPRRTGYLHDQQHHGQGLADVLERGRQGVDEAHVHERRERAGRHERHRAHALHAHDQVARAHDEGLHRAQHDEQKPAAQIPLRRPEGAHAAGINLQLDDGDEHEAADPQRQVGVERRHARPVVVHGVHRPRVDLHGRGHEVGHVGGLDAPQRRQFLDGGGVVQGLQVGDGGRQAVLRGFQRAAGGSGRALRFAQRAPQGVQQPLGLFEGGFQAGHGACHLGGQLKRRRPARSTGRAGHLRRCPAAPGRWPQARPASPR